MDLTLRDSAGLFEFIIEKYIPAFLYELASAYKYCAENEDEFVTPTLIIESELERYQLGDGLHEIMDRCYTMTTYYKKNQFFGLEEEEFIHFEETGEIPEMYMEYLVENWQESIYFEYEEEIERGLNALNLSYVTSSYGGPPNTLMNSPVLEVW